MKWRSLLVFRVRPGMRDEAVRAFARAIWRSSIKTSATPSVWCGWAGLIRAWTRSVGPLLSRSGLNGYCGNDSSIAQSRLLSFTATSTTDSISLKRV